MYRYSEKSIPHLVTLETKSGETYHFVEMGFGRHSPDMALRKRERKVWHRFLAPAITLHLARWNASRVDYLTRYL